MSLYQLQIKARDEWRGSAALQREYRTLEFYWWSRYQRVYCPGCRADFSALERNAAR